MNIVQYFGENESICGYCHSQQDTSVSTGLHCHSLKVEQYQQLVDRGWRRSGCYLYKPNMQHTCCPQYSIRLDVNKFCTNKAQKRVLRKWERFLAGDSMGGNQTAAQDVQDDVDAQQGSCDKRQKRSDSEPVREGVDVPAADLTGRPATASLQHETLQAQEGGYHAEELAIQQALRETLEQCMQSEQLPKISNLHQVKVGVPSQKMAKKLPGGVKLTTPAPQVLAGNYRKALGPGAPTAVTVGGIIAAALHARFQLPEWTAVHGGWAVSVLNGHLNFHVTPASTTDKAPALVSHCLHADGDADDAADARHAPDQAPLPQPTTTATVLKHDSSQAPAGTKPEADKAPAGNSPHGSLGNMWSGTALGCSLKQAIADQPSRSSAHPTDLGCNPAEENLTVTAHQEPALVVTVTKPPAALPSTLALPQTVLQVPSTESASGYKGLTADNTFAAGLTTQKSHGRGQPGGPSSTAAATQGTGASDAGGGGVAARGGAAVGVAAVTGGKAAVVAAGAGAGAGAAAQRGPGRAEAGSQAVAAKAEADATADRGSNDEPIAGRAPCSGGHSQGGHPPRHLDIRMVPAGPELVEVEYPLYYKYQIFNHHDKPSKLSKKQFLRFLIESPFPLTPPDAYPSGKCPPCGMGTFHQQYWLDGKLIAVGVLDVLPSCLSSVYFFWDKVYAALAPGKFSALKEAEWVQEAARHCPALHYYYMGFYVHSCSKMRYKADYHPSDLLCPERLCWIPFDRVKAGLDEQEYQVLSDLPGALEGLGREHALSLSMRQHWEQCRLSNAYVPPQVVADTLVFWRDAMSPYSLVRFGDLAERGAPKRRQTFEQGTGEAAVALQALLDVLKEQLQECHRLAGTAAAHMAFVP